MVYFKCCSATFQHPQLLLTADELHFVDVCPLLLVPSSTQNSALPEAGGLSFSFVVRICCSSS